MGFRQAEITPFQVTSITPSSKEIKTKVFQIFRSDTTATVKCVLPRGSLPFRLTFVNPVATNAGTTGTATVNIAGGAQPAFNTQVVSNATVQGVTAAVINTLLIEDNQTTDVVITGVYAETGAASTTGGPVTVIVEYVV